MGGGLGWVASVGNTKRNKSMYTLHAWLHNTDYGEHAGINSSGIPVYSIIVVVYLHLQAYTL